MYRIWWSSYNISIYCNGTKILKDDIFLTMMSRYLERKLNINYNWPTSLGLSKLANKVFIKVQGVKNGDLPKEYPWSCSYDMFACLSHRLRIEKPGHPMITTS